jgi:lysophospholipase L1-like esterase
VVCRGYSGYNSRWVRQVVPSVVDQPEGGTVTRLVTIFFGANDASLPAHNFRQHVPLAEYRENLVAIAAALRKQCPAAALLFVTPPPLDEATYLQQRFAGDPPVLSRTNAVAGEYAAAVEAVAAEVGAPCVNLWRGMQEAAPDG